MWYGICHSNRHKEVIPCSFSTSNPLRVFLNVAGEDVSLEDIAIFLIVFLALPYLVFSGLLWAGGLGFGAALLASIVIYPFWLTGNSGPIFGSALLTGLLSIAEHEPLPILHDIGWTHAMTIDTWLNQMSFSATVLALSSIYFVFVWPLSGLRKAIIGN